MSSFTDLTVTGLLSFGLGQGKLLAQGVQLQLPSTEPAALLAGNNANVVLPGFGGVGPMYYRFGTVASGAVITGFQTANLSIEPGQVLVVENAGANAIATAANSSNSSVGNRITAAISIGVGAGALFVYNGTSFVPLFTVAAS